VDETHLEQIEEINVTLFHGDAFCVVTQIRPDVILACRIGHTFSEDKIIDLISSDGRVLIRPDVR
jgi:hypothetical protein